MMTTSRYRVRYPWQATAIREAIGDGDDTQIVSASSDPGADWIDAGHFSGEDHLATLGRLKRIAASCGVNPEHVWVQRQVSDHVDCCDECGAEIAYDADGCEQHPDAAITSIPTPQCAPSVRLTEVSRQRSLRVPMTGAADIRILLTVAGQIGERNYGVGRMGTMMITLVPVSDEPGVRRPFGDALDHWLADRDGLLAELPESVQRAIVDELASWLDDERRAVDVDIAEVPS